MTVERTGAQTDLTGGMPATDAGADERPAQDPLAALDAAALRTFASIADRLIPSAHDMPSAAEVVNGDRLRFVLNARPDLVDPLAEALRPELGDDVAARLEALERDEPAALASLQLVIVAGYYTDVGVRERIGYPGQQAITFEATSRPAYVEEGLIDAVIRRGPRWRDPATGNRSTETGTPPDYAAVFRSDAARPEGGEHGPDGS
jgi:hypothetical protein